MKRWAGLISAALLLGGCSAGAAGGTSASPDNEPQSADSFEDLLFAPDIEAMLPEQVQESGVLRVGISPFYRPAEFMNDGKIDGYSADIAKGIGILMGLEVELVPVAFNEIFLGLGSDFDVAISSLSVTSQRLELANMVTYMTASSQYVVATSPAEPLPAQFPCGANIGVLDGSTQVAQLEAASQDCIANDAQPISIVTAENQNQLFYNVKTGISQATLVDTTAAQSAIALAGGKLKAAGDPQAQASQGVAVSLQDEQLTVAVQASLQRLLDLGYVGAVLDAYGLDDTALTQSVINPRVA